ncbi:Transcriptional regulator WAR1 [Apiospora arundinis]|uniref:Transcriptional regulator WAR1 n=1 Tax=Apiospora arundinis TaxID=335852 RepID=A0ABR2I2S8_9PEZI
MDRPKSAAVAKWGAACAPCATAKAKCLRSNQRPGSKCDRCERLEKDCLDQVHRPRKKRQSKPSRTAQLEERLNSLVEILRATNAGDVPASFKNPPNPAEDTHCIPSETFPRPSEPQGASVSLSSGSTPAGTNFSEAYQTVPSYYNQYAPPRCICRAPVGESVESVEDDDVLLSIFVNKLSQSYPFVVLRPGTTADELKATKPFLFIVIRMVASVRHLKSMRAQSFRIMKHISDYMLVRSERSLEMLQALLLVLGWYHYHCMMHSQMSNLSHLATSLCADLGINRPPGLHERTRLLVLNPEQPKARTNDERRALCGAWYVNSCIALSYQRVEQGKYTGYIHQCLKELEAANEYETDSLLVQLIRIQHLSDKISCLHNKGDEDIELPAIPRAPTSAYLGAFQAELDKFKAQIPRHLRTNRVLSVHICTATLRLWEPPKMDAAVLEDLSNSLTSLSLGAPSTLDFLYRSNAALKAWFECWLSIDVNEYFYLTMPLCGQLINAVMLLSRWFKLSSMDPPTACPPQTSRQQQPTSSSSSSSSGKEQQHPPPHQNPYHNHHDLSDMIDREDADRPGVPAAVLTIKSHILAQPELRLDIVGILRALVARLEEARNALDEAQGGVENNIWDLAAKKIGITRLKLERWAEIVATMGMEGLLTRKHERDGDSSPGSDEETEEGSGEGQGQRQGKDDAGAVPLPATVGVAATTADGSAAMEGVEMSGSSHNAGAGAWPQPPHTPGLIHTEAWMYDSNMLANNLFDELGLDQNFFYDNNDYGGAILNSLGGGNAGVDQSLNR